MLNISNISAVDSPALIVFEETVSSNIRMAKEIAGDVARLRPHVKTNKTREVCRMMMYEGITKFKCATIAEAEMLAMIGAPDILLAYQPTGPKIERLLNLTKTYPQSRFSCLVDDARNAEEINSCFAQTQFTVDVMIDVNTGMNRTGISPDKASDLAEHTVTSLKQLRLVGIHGYDGHIHETDLTLRRQAADISFAEMEKACKAVQQTVDCPLKRVVGGTVTFPIHIEREGVECSPGTFVFWDWGYRNMLPDLPFRCAAFIVCRVISVIDGQHVCVDLGYKSVASESPLPRIHFLNAPEAKPVAQSEEHLVLETSEPMPVGHVLYGIPVHICPTVALYGKMWIVRNNTIETSWEIVARNRYINI